MNTSELIQPRHLNRRAAIYVRQSSPHQVIVNQESQRIQYALRDRALQLGWHEHGIDIIDTDLGHTATTTEGRLGFQHLVSRIALAEVGIVIAYDATRLARNCSHWYQLLDLCGRADCLIADRDGVYDPSSINGRLLLGLKGQISELEMHTLRARLIAGIVNKAQRGELALTLPTGLVRLEDGRVVKHPDREVQDRIALVFTTLLEKKSLAQLVHHFRRQSLKLPRRNEVGEIQWKRPTVASVGSMVKNPAYAGAFAYGRTRWKRCENTAKTQGTTLPRSQWRVLVRDKYPAYISWDTYELIERMLMDNHTEYSRNKTRGVPRDGKALLHGIVYCGECGHKMCVQYKSGTRYLCNHLRQQTGEPVCQYIPADPIDDQVVKWFFEAISIAEIDLAQLVLHETDQQHSLLLKTRRQELDRLRYQTRLAERQYQQTDPDNRLVASELEHRWEMALRELKEAEERLTNEERQSPSWAIPADLLDMLKNVGAHLPEIWSQGLITSVQKKSLLRSLIDKVVIHRVGGHKGDRVQTRVVWQGGATTTHDVLVTVGSFAQLQDADKMKNEILRLTREGKSDDEIARVLTDAGHRSPLRGHVLPSTVKATRLKHRVLIREHQSHPRHVPGYLTIPQLADKLKVPTYWIHDRIRKGIIRVKKDATTKCYLFPDKKDTLKKFQQLFAGKITELGF